MIKIRSFEKTEKIFMEKMNMLEEKKCLKKGASSTQKKEEK